MMRSTLLLVCLMTALGSTSMGRSMASTSPVFRGMAHSRIACFTPLIRCTWWAVVSFPVFWATSFGQRSGSVVQGSWPSCSSS